MSNRLNRRGFLKTATGIFLTLPFLRRFPEPLIRRTTLKSGLPVMLCSRSKASGEKVLTASWETLKSTGSILDAVEKGANVVELDPEDMSVGYGGLPNEEGVVQLDASIMYGPTHNCGSVASLENIKTASSVARLVMERTDHIHLVGEGALRFAKAHGFKEEDLLTDKARRFWLRWKENLSDKDDWLPPVDEKYEIEEEGGTGTINVLGIDADSNVAGVTTTSGLAWKIPGRVGDSPIIGAGLYVDNEVGAAGATGRGEEVIRTCGSFYLVEKMRSGMSPQEACKSACQRIIDINGGPENIEFNDKFVAVNKDGEIGCASILGRKGREPGVSYIDNDGFHVFKGKYLIEVKEQ